MRAGVTLPQSKPTRSPNRCGTGRLLPTQRGCVAALSGFHPDRDRLKNGLGLLILTKAVDRQIPRIDLILLLGKREARAAMAAGFNMCQGVSLMSALIVSMLKLQVNDGASLEVIFNPERPGRHRDAANNHGMESDAVFPRCSGVSLRPAQYEAAVGRFAGNPVTDTSALTVLPSASR